MACKVIVGDQEYSFEDFRKHLKTEGIDDFIKNNKQHFYAKTLRGNQSKHAEEGVIAQGSENVSGSDIQRNQEEGGGTGNGPLRGGVQNLDQQKQEISPAHRVAHAYHEEVKNPSVPAHEVAIADEIGKVTNESYSRWGDKNTIRQSVAQSYFNKK